MRPRPYRIVPRRSVVTVEGRDPIHAERQARSQHPHLAGEDLIVVAAHLAWEREVDPYARAHPERVENFTTQANAASSAPVIGEAEAASAVPSHGSHSARLGTLRNEVKQPDRREP